MGEHCQVNWLSLPCAAGLATVVVVNAALGLPAWAQDEQPAAPAVNRTVPGLPVDPDRSSDEETGAPGPDTVDVEEGVRPNALLHVPITGIFPDGVRPDPDLGDLPVDSPEAAYAGMAHFNQFNCSGCHAPNGGGGMGPSLSNSTFKYGGDPENIYLTILQGRPLGMPAFGGILPDSVIWELVAYVRSISREQTGQWGRTTSLEAFSIEQVPAQYTTTVNPWEHTQPFSYGRPPFLKVEVPEKPE